MKITLTPKSHDKDFCKVVIDGFGDKPREGITDESTKEIALDIQKLLSKHYLKIEWLQENLK